MVADESAAGGRDGAFWDVIAGRAGPPAAETLGWELVAVDPLDPDPGRT
jgi:hypothetical protein